jgi:nicotine blue oxidoreductase
MTPRDQDVRPVAGLLLAAGAGRRLGGRPKALLPYRGGLLVDHAAEVLRAGGCRPVHVVLGAAADEVRERAALSGCTVVGNPGWASGMGSSLRAGLASLAGSEARAVLVTLVDQPGVGVAAVRRVLARAPAGEDALAAAGYGGRRGHPVLLGAGHWAGVAAAADADRGARAYLASRQEEITLVECGDVAAPDDIDTPEDLRLLER